MHIASHGASARNRSLAHITSYIPSRLGMLPRPVACAVARHHPSAACLSRCVRPSLFRLSRTHTCRSRCCRATCASTSMRAPWRRGKPAPRQRHCVCRWGSMPSAPGEYTRQIHGVCACMQVGIGFEPGDIIWDERTTVLYPLWCSCAGLIAGMFGVGGGIVKGPLMLHLGVLPEVAAATSATMILFTSCALPSPPPTPPPPLSRAHSPACVCHTCSSPPAQMRSSLQYPVPRGRWSVVHSLGSPRAPPPHPAQPLHSPRAPATLAAHK